ncbi:hypothetical protein CLOP_g2336 [Closterium sp. NIES-67]|nr:hypothetical protein CLOP_g2336 [Closterium sp. NIES-67]
MLDGLDSASIEMEHAKRKLAEMMTTNDPPVLSPTHGQPPALQSPRRPSQSRSHSRSSSSSSTHSSSLTSQPSGPWMTDAPWLPDRPLSKLHKLVELIKALAAHAKEKCREDDVDGALEAEVEEAVKKLRIVPVPPPPRGAHQKGQGQQGVEQQGAGQQGVGQQKGGKQKAVPYDSTVLGKARFDESRIAAGLPCGTEEFLLIFARWKKLERDIYNPRKDRFNISKIPDVYDSAKYDLVHNRHLHLKGLHELFLLAKEMANGVIPNEYGITPYSKLNIGAKVARRLLGKLLIDLHNTRDEAVAVGQAMQQHRQCLKEQRAAAVAAAVFNQEQARQHRRSSGEAKRRSDGQPEGDNDDSNAQYRLDPKYANVRTPQRHVRTRLYFTSESHLHSVMNVLRFCQLDESLQGEAPLLSPDALTRLYEMRELDYLTHVVLRMYENVEVDLNDPRRFRVEIMFSPGSCCQPSRGGAHQEGPHAASAAPLHGAERRARPAHHAPHGPHAAPLRHAARGLPPPVQPQGFSGLFLKGTVFERIVSFWPFRNTIGGGSKSKGSCTSSSGAASAATAATAAASGSNTSLPTLPHASSSSSSIPDTGAAQGSNATVTTSSSGSSSSLSKAAQGRSSPLRTSSGVPLVSASDVPAAGRSPGGSPLRLFGRRGSDEGSGSGGGGGLWRRGSGGLSGWGGGDDGRGGAGGGGSGRAASGAASPAKDG